MAASSRDLPGTCRTTGKSHARLISYFWGEIATAKPQDCILDILEDPAETFRASFGPEGAKSADERDLIPTTHNQRRTRWQ